MTDTVNTVTQHTTVASLALSLWDEKNSLITLITESDVLVYNRNLHFILCTETVENDIGIPYSKTIHEYVKVITPNGRRIRLNCTIYSSDKLNKTIYYCIFEDKEYYCSFEEDEEYAYLRDNFDFFVKYYNNGDINEAYRKIFESVFSPFPKYMSVAINEQEKSVYDVKRLNWELIPKDNFVYQYVKYMLDVVGGHEEYKTSGALALLATASNRKHCIYLSHNMSSKAYYLNLYTIIIGESSKSKKTTTMDEIKFIISMSGVGPVISADLSSKDALIKSLAHDSHQMLMVDECDYLLDGMRSQNSYLKDFDNIFNQLYSCSDYTKQNMKSTYEIKDPYFNIFFACTDTGFEGAVDEKVATGGFLARTLVIKPVSKFKLVDTYQPTEEELRKVFEENPLVERYREIWSAGIEFSSIRLVFSKKVIDKFNELNRSTYEDADVIKSQGMFRSRMNISNLKIAGLLYIGSPEYLEDLEQKTIEMMENRGMKQRHSVRMMSLGNVSLEVPDKYYDIAVAFSEDYYIPTLMNLFDASLTSDNQSMLSKIRTKLINAPNHELSISALHTGLGGGLRGTDYNGYLDEMVESGEIVRYKVKGKGKKQVCMVKLVEEART